jgi:hypothetical protein
MNKTVLNLLLDTGLLLTLFLMYEVKATGEAIHEWLGVGIALVMIVHILLHWQWVLTVTQRFLTGLKAEPRVQYILNIGIFIGFTTIIFSGLMISRSILPIFGLQGSNSWFWKWLHIQSADITFMLAALHIALHWQWIVNAARRYLISPVLYQLHLRTE